MDAQMVPLRILNSEVMRLVSLSLDTGVSMAATAEDFKPPTALQRHELSHVLHHNNARGDSRTYAAGNYYLFSTFPIDADVSNGLDEFQKPVLDLSMMRPDQMLPALDRHEFLFCMARFRKVGFMAFENLLANKTITRWRDRGHLVSSWQDRGTTPGILATSLHKGFVANDMGYAAAAFVEIFPELLKEHTLSDVWAYK